MENNNKPGHGDAPAEHNANSEPKANAEAHPHNNQSIYPTPHAGQGHHSAESADGIASKEPNHHRDTITDSHGSSSAVSNTPYVSVAINQATYQPSHNLYQKKSFLGLSKWLKVSGVYLAEFALLLIVLTTLLCVANSMFATIIESVLNKTDNSNWWSAYSYPMSLGMLAAMTVMLPLFIILNKRTHGSELLNPRSKQTTWRKAFSGIFLIGVSLAAIGYTVAFTYEIFSWLASMGLTIEAADKSSILRSVMKELFGIILFGYTAWLYANDFRSTEKSAVHGAWGKIHRYALVGILLLLGLLFVFLPLRKQRNTFIDAGVSNDLRAIKTSVQDYANNKKLPEDLSVITIDSAVKKRITSNKYSYAKRGTTKFELCANFRTNTKDSKSSGSSGNILDSYLNGSSYGGSSMYKPDEQDPGVHGTGKQCFTFSVSPYGNRYTPQRNTPPIMPNDTMNEDMQSDF